MKLRIAYALVATGLFGSLGVGCPPPLEEDCLTEGDEDGNGTADCEDPVCQPRPECEPDLGCPIDVNFPTRDATTAVDLTINTPTEGHLCPARDDDGYRVDVPNPGSVLLVTVSMETSITPLFLGYSILNGDGTPTGIFFQDPDTTQGGVANFTGAHRVEDAGEYIIVVADVEGLDDAFDNTNPYTLNVDVIADPDVNEPNNTPQAPRAIAPGTTNGIIATSGDDDWYAIEVAANAQIIDAVITVPADSGIEHTATLFAPDGITVLQTVAFAPGDVPGEETAHLRKAASGVAGEPFLLKIEDGGVDGDLDAELDVAIAGYTIELTVLADPDANEGAAGNETVETATPVNSGQTVSAALATFADQDLYRVVPPAGTTANAPRVLVVEVVFDGTIDAEFKPQVQVITTDPEDATPPPCGGACSFCIDGTSCGEQRLQRFVAASPFRTAYPLRNTVPLYVAVNEFNDDGVQLAGGYTINFQIVADTDPGEVGDDFLIANLEEAGFANGGDLDNQLDESKPRARAQLLNTQPVCDEATPTGVDCLDLVAVANPVLNGFDDLTVACTDFAPITRTLTGRLTYEGDRDYFVFPDFPARGYFGFEVDYTISQDTPVELALFIHNNNGSLFGNTLEATDVGNCAENQGGQNACPPASVCVDENCWTESAANPGRSATFGDDECAVTNPRGFSAPVFIEVVDNGINDFDLDMTYTLNVTITCGCPASCDNGLDFCQDGP